MTEENTTPEPVAPSVETPPAVPRPASDDGELSTEGLGDPRPNDPIVDSPAQSAAEQGGIVTMVEDSEPEPAQEVLAPISQQTQAEMDAGRQKIAEHEGRQKLMEGKRASDVEEGEAVTKATSANSDL